jgi:ribonuclease HI
MDQWKAKGWKRGRQPPKNLELRKALDELRQVHQLTCHWVRGHNDHVENERCDKLAVAAIERVRGGC